MNKMSQMKMDALEKFATSFRADFRSAPLNIMMLIGIGGIFAAGVISIIKMSPVMVQALRQVFGEIRKLGKGGAAEATGPRTDRDIPMVKVAGLLVATSLAIGLYFRFVVLADQPGATGKALAALALTLVISGLFAAVSAWAPVSSTTDRAGASTESTPM